jgi:hypothetical protein
MIEQWTECFYDMQLFDSDAWYNLINTWYNGNLINNSLILWTVSIFNSY